MAASVPSQDARYRFDFDNFGRNTYDSPVLPAVSSPDCGLDASNCSVGFYLSPQSASYDSPSPTYPTNRRANIPSLLSAMSRFNIDNSHDNTDGSLLSPIGLTPTRTTLPARVLDENGAIKASFAEVVSQPHLLEAFAKDKIGCRFLQDNYPDVGTAERAELFTVLATEKDFFEDVCDDVFGNFFCQVLFGESQHCPDEQTLLFSKMHGDVYRMSLNRYSCRVVQKALENFSNELKCRLLVELQFSANVPMMAADQNANHVLQKIFTACPVYQWSFIVEQMIKSPKNFYEVVENKYGCRVFQQAIEILSSDSKHPDICSHLLEQMMAMVMRNCDRLVANEFANYVVQNVLMAGKLADYRDIIIDRCLLRNLLSMSQEKYASHVVEKAFAFAPPHLLKEMMTEIFEGYVPHPDTKKDALDILLFHQYGNYVVQRMLDICCEAVRAQRGGIILHDLSDRLDWFHHLHQRIALNANRLNKYSSGKKILDMIAKLGGFSQRANRQPRGDYPLRELHLQY